MVTKRPSIGIALALLSLALLGIMPIISDRKPDASPALAFACYLSLWQLVCSLPGFAMERQHRLGHSRNGVTGSSRLRLRTLMIATGIIFGLSTLMYVQGVEKAGAVSFAIALQAYPVFSILWESLFLGRRKSPAELFFTGTMIVAVCFAGTGGGWTIEGFSFWFLFALGVPFLWSVAHVTLKEVIDATGITPHQIVFSRLLISTLFLWVVALSTHGPGYLLEPLSEERFQIFALVMGVVYYLELINWFYAVRHIAVSLASSITAPAPLVTMLIAALLFGEPVATYQIVAMGLVIGGMLGLINAGKERRARPEAVSLPNVVR